MNLETKITIYKFTPQVFTLTRYNLPLSTISKGHAEIRRSPFLKYSIYPSLLPKDKYNIYSSINSYFPSGNQRSNILSTSDSISGVT